MHNLCRATGDIAMIQCTQCELCEVGPDGRRAFKCDPFSNIKEPECVAKWQLIRLDMLLGQLSEYAAMAKRDGADTAENDEIRREGNERYRRER